MVGSASAGGRDRGLRLQEAKIGNVSCRRQEASGGAGDGGAGAVDLLVTGNREATIGRWRSAPPRIPPCGRNHQPRMSGLALSGL